MRLKLELDDDIARLLLEEAARQRRPPAWQAEVMLRDALLLCGGSDTERAREERINDAQQAGAGTPGAGTPGAGTRAASHSSRT